MSIEEIRADRDARISALRKEIDDITVNSQRIEQENAMLTSHNKTLQTNYDFLNEELAKTIASLTLSNATRI
jgi:hypothetical protein